MNGSKEVVFLKLILSLSLPLFFSSLIDLDLAHPEWVVFSYCNSLSPAKSFPSLMSSMPL